MHRLSDPTLSAPITRHPQPGQTYLLYGIVYEISGQDIRPDNHLLDKLIIRRLKRLERVLSSHGGTLLSRMPQGLLASFRTAEEALVGACEMQRRCAVIPQLSDTQLALKIGIHLAYGKRLAASSTNPATATAAKLSSLIDDAGIVLSEPVLAELPLALKGKSTPVPNDGSAIAAFAIDWNALPFHRTPYTSTSIVNPEGEKPPPGTLIVLRLGQRDYRFDHRQNFVAIGRSPANHIMVSSPRTSRQHCQIVFRAGQYALIDCSANGTYLYSANGEEIHLRKNSRPLPASGRISFGQVWRAESPYAFEFEVISPA